MKLISIPLEVNETKKTDENFKTKQEVIYRRNGKTINKIIEFDSQTNSKL